MNWQSPPYVAVLLLTALLSVIVAYFALRLRHKPGGLWLGLVMLAAAEWSFALALESAAVGIPAKVFWSKVEYLGITSAPVLLLMFALEFTHREKWLHRHRLILLWIVPIITLGLAATNEWHHLIWTSVTPSPIFGSDIVIYSHGTWFWIAAAYIYLILCASTILLIRAALRFRHLYRRQAIMLLVGMLPPWIANALYLLDLSPVPGLELTPIGFALTGMMLTWSFIRLQLLDLVPVARDKVIENMSDGTLVLDAQNRIVDINPAAEKLIGVDGESAIGQTAEAVLAGWTGLVGRYWDVLDQTQVLMADGVSHIELRVSPLYEQGGRLSGRLIILRDVTKRVRAEKELKEYAERLGEMVEERTKELREAQERLIRREKLVVLGQMAGGVGHELRNPLGVISNAVYFLQMALPDADETTREYLDMISSEVRNSTKIISDLLDFSRTRLPEREEIAVSDLVAQVLAKRPPPEGVQVTTQIPSDLPAVFVDPQQIIDQVLGNLVTNGYQAMTSASSVEPPDGGGLTITAELVEGGTIRNPKSQIRIGVSDSGVGIPAENMEKIFEPLFTTKAKGIGLGLALVKTLVEANGGSIEAESEEGRGSTFTIRLQSI